MASVPTPRDLRVGDGLGEEDLPSWFGGKGGEGRVVKISGLDCKIRWAAPFPSQKVGVLFRVVHRGSLGRACLHSGAWTTLSNPSLGSGAGHRDWKGFGVHRKIAWLGEGAGLACFLSLSLCGQMPATVVIFSQLVEPFYFQGILREQDLGHFLGKR